MLNVSGAKVSFDEVRRQMDIWQGFAEANDPEGKTQFMIEYVKRPVPAPRQALQQIRTPARYIADLMISITYLRDGRALASYRHVFQQPNNLTKKYILGALSHDLDWLMQGIEWIDADNPRPVRMSQLYRHIIEQSGEDPGEYARKVIANANGQSMFMHYASQLIHDHGFTDHEDECEAIFYDDDNNFPEMAGEVSNTNMLTHLKGSLLLDRGTRITVGNDDAISTITSNIHAPESLINTLGGKPLDQIIDHHLLKGVGLSASGVKNENGRLHVEFFDPIVFADSRMDRDFPQDQRKARLKTWAET